MALFPSLEMEGEVQIKDKTRFWGRKSYVSKGANPITIMTVKPGSDQTPVSIFASSVDDRFLDWEFLTWNTDITANNQNLDFSEGASLFNAVLTPGTYTLAQLAVEIQTQMNAVGSNTYTVSVSPDDKITISANGQFALLPLTGVNRQFQILKHIGFSEEPGQTATSRTGERVEYLQKEITLTIGDGTTTQAITKVVQVYSEAGDNLFSSDEDLTAEEPEILNWVPPGRNSFKDVHRRAQKNILANLDENGYTDIYDEKFAKRSVINVDEFNQWSTYMALRLIFEGIHNSKDDVFMEKAKIYASQEINARNRAIILLDIDRDGKQDKGEGITSKGFSGRVFRR